MKTITFDAWASLFLNGQESGDRQPCQLTIELAKNGTGRVAIDRKLSFSAGRGGVATIVFFYEEEGDNRLMEWMGEESANNGFTLTLKPAPASPLVG